MLRRQLEIPSPAAARLTTRLADDGREARAWRDTLENITARISEHLGWSRHETEQLSLPRLWRLDVYWKPKD